MADRTLQLIRIIRNAIIILGGVYIFSMEILTAQTIYSTRIKGIRITSTLGAAFPAALRSSHPITVSFDVDSPHPENFIVKIFHCGIDWNTTASSFINDEFRNYSRNQLHYEIAPAGVKHYRWTYSFRIPNPANQNEIHGFNDFEQIPQSGNYRFEIWSDSESKESELLATGRFYIVEKLDDSALTIENRYIPSETSPRNQGLRVSLRFNISSQNVVGYSDLHPNNIKMVDILRNREQSTFRRIEDDDRDPHTYIDDWGTNNLKFVVENIQPGNEYRQLDLQNHELYPPEEQLRSLEGADMSRWLWQGNGDQDGSSIIVTGTRYADYIQYKFELGLPENSSDEKIFVVGDFNNWLVNEQWQLRFNQETKKYKVIGSLRRGKYDYQYVQNENDWIALEGNDWRTVSVYTALLYYHDPNYGGFDRILLAAQKRNPGGTEATTR